MRTKADKGRRVKIHQIFADVLYGLSLMKPQLSTTVIIGAVRTVCRHECSQLRVVMCSIPSDPASTVQASVGRDRLGVEAHYAPSRRHWTQHSLSTAAERRSSGHSCTELLSDVLHQYTGTPVLCGD